MALFTEDTKVKLAPRTQESITGGNILTDIATGGAPTIPQQGVAELTPVQMLIQQELGPLLERLNAGGQLATNEYTKTLTDQYDPRTSPYYEGLRSEAERLTNQGVTRLRQRAELGGNLQSTPAAAQEGEFVNQANSALLTELGKLYESERNRKTTAAEGIQRAGAQETSNIAAVGGIAETARTVEQQRADALYNQIIQQILFPYQYQAQLASTLLNYSPNTVTTGGGLSDLGFWLNFNSQAFGGAAGAMAGKM